MTSTGKQLYDREDLDDEEQKLFDEMVLEEMEKLENQFKESSVDDGRRDQRLPTLQLDTMNDNSREGRALSSAHGRSNEYNMSQRSEPRHQESNASIASTAIRSGDQPMRRAPRIALVAENLPRRNQNASLNSSEGFDEDHQEQQPRREISNYDSRSPLQDPHQSARRYRRGETSPDSRVESNISLIGAGDSSTVSPSQKREQQAKYAMQLAEGTANSRSARTQVDSFGSKPSRRVSAEMSMEDANVVSSIGQDNQQLKERRKMQQLEYAQQLSNQQSQRHLQNNSPVLDESPRSRDSGMHSARGSNHFKDGSPTSNRSGVVNFGSDPAVEAAKKREMKAAYGRQLQEQQNNEQDNKNYREGNRSNSFRDGNITTPRYTGYDSREDDRNVAKSAAEMKREQQKKYRDEISSAASAAPITSARASLQRGQESGPSSGSGSGSAQPRKRGNTDAYDQSNGSAPSGLIGGTSSSFLSSADAERLESRSKKVQLQQMYAKQLMEDSASVSLSGSSISRNGSSSGMHTSSLPSTRRTSMESHSYNEDSRGNSRPISGTSLMSAVNVDGKGMFDPMSEKDQSAMAAAKKKASQVEYYQQLQDADNMRPDPAAQANQRVTLYRSRDQREQEGAPMSRPRDSGSARQSPMPMSMPNGGYPQRGQGESSGYQGQPYSMGAGPGLSSRTSASDPRSMADGEIAYARKCKQDEYARALRSDAETGAIPDSYTAQRRSHHDREGPGNASRDGRTYGEEKCQERDVERYQEREQGRSSARDHASRYPQEVDTEIDGYSGKQYDKYNLREEALESQRYREREQPKYQPVEEGRHYGAGSGRHDRSSIDPDPRIDNYSYNRPNGSVGYDSSMGPANNGEQGTNDQYRRVGSSLSSPRGNESSGGAGQRERGRQEGRGQGTGYSSGQRGDTDNGYSIEESGPRSLYPSYSQQHEKQYEQMNQKSTSGSNSGPSAGNRIGEAQAQGQERGQYQGAPQGGNFSQRDTAQVPVSVPVSGRGRSSGGGASSISLYG